ncbi:hypothetical protein OQA88_5782 [Cercophora sp. LCS_1]
MLGIMGNRSWHLDHYNGNPLARSVASSSSHGTEYLALSYVWGAQKQSGPPPQARGKLPPVGVPRVIRDAITVVKALGKQYLWVDKYCVDQESHALRAQEIRSMDRVYNGAYATIAGCSGDNSSFGLPGVGEASRLLQPSAITPAGVLLSTLPPLHVAIKDSVWMTRGYPTDILDAFKGILSKAPFFSYWGIPIAIYDTAPECNQLSPREIELGFLRCLLWSPSFDYKKGFGVPLTRRQGFPSWTWAGWKGSVDYAGPSGVLIEGVGTFIQMDQEETKTKVWALKILGEKLSILELQQQAGVGRIVPELTPYISIQSQIIKLHFQRYNIDHENQFTRFRPWWCWCHPTSVHPYDIAAPSEAILWNIPSFYTFQNGDENALRRITSDPWDCVLLFVSSSRELRWEFLIVEWKGSIAYRVGAVTIQDREQQHGAGVRELLQDKGAGWKEIKLGNKFTMVDKTPSVDEAKPTATVSEKPVDKSTAPSDSSDDELVPHLHAKTFLAVFAVCLIYSAQLVNLVGAGVQGQTIAAHFGDTTNAVWISSPIAIVTVVLSPIIAQAADYWGRKWFLVVLTLIGAIGSVIVARASSMNMAIAGFCVIGIAYGNQPLIHVVTSEVLPRRWRGWAQAFDLISNSVGGILGIYVGAAFNRTNDPTSNGFRNYYYLTTGIFLLASILCALVYNPPPLSSRTQLTTREKLAKLDWTGYIFLAMGLVLFSVGLSYSKNPHPWSNPLVSATFALGLLFILCLAGYESILKKDGMFHHALFTRNFSLAVFCVFCEGLAFFAANTYFAFQVAVLYETDSLLIGVRYSIVLYVMAISACLTGWYCAATRRVRCITVAAFVIFVMFFVCMATTTSSRSSNAPVWFFPVLLGAALGVVLTTLVTTVQLSTPPELISVASGLVISARSLGGTVGLAVYNAVFNERMGELGGNVASKVLPLGVKEGDLEAFIGALMGGDVVGLEGIEGVTDEVLQVAAAAFLIDPRKEFNMRIDAPVEKEEDLYSV